MKYIIQDLNDASKISIVDAVGFVPAKIIAPCPADATLDDADAIVISNGVAVLDVAKRDARIKAQAEIRAANLKKLQDARNILMAFDKTKFKIADVPDLIEALLIERGLK